MASTPDKNKPAPEDPKKPASAANQRLAELQKKAGAAGIGRKPVSPTVFFQEAWVELKKTTWPTKDVLIKSTTVVLALVVAVAIWVGVIDALAGRIFTPLFTATPQ